MNTKREYAGGSGLPPGIREVHLTPEDIELWRNCMRESVFKFALPIATVIQLIKNFSSAQVPIEKKITQKWGGLKNAGFFIFNVGFLMLLRSPYCIAKLEKRLSDLEKDKSKSQAMDINIKSSEGNFQLPEDVNFQSNLDPKLDGPDSNFSHLDLDLDLSSGDNLQMEDVDKKAELSTVPRTTYDDLRRRNRENYYRQFITSPNRYDQQMNVAPEPQKQKPKSSFPSAISKKNKYGDEVEE